MISVRMALGRNGKVIQVDARHHEVRRDKSPCEFSPPWRTCLIEWYALEFLDVAIVSWTFASQESPQALGERS